MSKRRRILGVGVAAWDIVNQVAVYPREDADVRTRGQRVVRGGNAANTLSVLSQLGHACAWAGTLGGDASGELVLKDLERHHIDTRACVLHPDGSTPVSYVILSLANGSRTIVHHRDLPELSAADFARIPLAGHDWVHFEGRNPEETSIMLSDCRERLPGIKISVEVEKPRPGIELLLAGPEVLIFSRSYALSCGYAEPRRFLDDQWDRTQARLLVLPWGEKGAYAQSRGGAICFARPHIPSRVRDTLGAGDVFNAGLIDGLLSGLELPALLARASALAGHKCGVSGMDGVVASARGAGVL
jgi:ketohexokinase